jgi:hypothetical protein
VLTILVMGVSMGVASALLAYLESGSPPQPDTINSALRAAGWLQWLVPLVFVAASVLAGVLAMVWTWRVRVNAEAVSPQQHVLERYWAWAGWITPIVSLWFPYQMLRDIDRADRAVLDAARTTSPPAPVAGWWFCYLAYWTIPQVAGEVSSSLTISAVAYVLGSVAGVVAFILFRRVVHTIQSDQESISSGVADERRT